MPIEFHHNIEKYILNFRWFNNWESRLHKPELAIFWELETIAQTQKAVTAY